MVTQMNKLMDNLILESNELEKKQACWKKLLKTQKVASIISNIKKKE